MKLHIGIGLLALIVGLSGCTKNNNPLLQAPEKDAATFLVKSSRFAQTKLGLSLMQGNVYAACMKGTEKETICHLAYDYMVQYAKRVPPFESIEVANLQDKAMWKALKEPFDSIDFAMETD